MIKRPLSQTPAAIEARQRRLMKSIDRQERKFHAEVKALVDKGMTFDEAWVAAGGTIIRDVGKTCPAL